MAFRTDSEFTAMSEINVTPLVDVMLVLLVVFMVTAPLLMQAVSVKLPKTAAVAPLKPTPALELNLTNQGDILLGRTKVSSTALEAELKARYAKTPNAAVRLRADERVPYGQIAQVMAAVSRSGFQKVALVTAAGTGVAPKTPAAK
ncbi:MAG: biopolymer transporter ExbD [Betaproteobacteria bacterium]|nr:MAG: biopolymer transporter ExbD [Betaproteobacteria bacterium]